MGITTSLLTYSELDEYVKLSSEYSKLCDDFITNIGNANDIIISNNANICSKFQELLNSDECKDTLIKNKFIDNSSLYQCYLTTINTVINIYHRSNMPDENILKNYTPINYFDVFDDDYEKCIDLLLGELLMFEYFSFINLYNLFWDCEFIKIKCMIFYTNRKWLFTKTNNYPYLSYNNICRELYKLKKDSNYKHLYHKYWKICPNDTIKIYLLMRRLIGY